MDLYQPITLVCFGIYLVVGDSNNIVTLCENDSINITCDGDSVIVVEDVLFGPSHDNMYNSDPDSEYCSLTDRNSTRFPIDSICSDRHTCLLNNSLDYFSLACPYVERKVNITYRCEYEYVGCFVDGWIRVLDGEQFKHQKNLSANICNKLCNSDKQSYFGTEHADECFCGNGGKLYTSSYGEAASDQCNFRCIQNENENCGGEYKISVYKSNTEVRRMDSVTVAEIKSKTCEFSSELKDIRLVSFTTSADCDNIVFIDSLNSSNTRCDEETICVEQPIILPEDKLDDFRFLSKYVKINYSCLGPEAISNRGMKSGTDAEDNSQKTVRWIQGFINPGTLYLPKPDGRGIIVGTVVCLGLACVALFTAYIMKRWKVKTDRENNKETHYKSEQDNVYVNYTLTETGNNVTGQYVNVENGDRVLFHCKSEFNNEQTYQQCLHKDKSLITNDVYDNNPIQPSPKHSQLKLSIDGFYEQTDILKKDVSRVSSSSDLYVDQTEGVYDEANKTQYKTKQDKEQTIYSHAIDDVYDSAIDNTCQPIGD